jgi:hypothetical protein
MSANFGASAQVDSALRRAFSEASVRLQPDCKISAVVEALKTLGLTVEVTDGLLVLSQGTTTMHTALALRSLTTKPEFKQFFVLSTDDPKTWTVTERTAFITKNGGEAYRKLICAPVLEAGLKVLDANMSRTDYGHLTRAEKIQFITEFGSGAVSAIMKKAK